ncbi:phosphate transport system protein [Desulfobaculum xiamenense]|uniref:Phosphate-specific transport system accessory protein PhoU n=1 Tax=Desulfobaculum xiamenense TaxID=995050 RepID=A0A846QVB1_9BACT|nr:phosphate signaling complex protein PhoU [Desulfobaculum xiamenense]NJB69054.1 phosphate transport system protein [Desulfobaculum xiamenense]
MNTETHFHKQLEGLRMQILEMAAYAERAMRQAADALLRRDAELAEQVIEGDKVINDMEMRIDEVSLHLLALDAPMARDLRFITGVRRAIIDLERIGDEAVNIAEKTVFLSRLAQTPRNPQLEELVEVVLDMLKVAIEGFREGNVDKATDVCRMDYRADELNLRILTKTMDDMVAEITGVRRAVNTILAARHLERVGDLSTNLAETTIFIVKGLNVMHSCQKP